MAGNGRQASTSPKSAVVVLTRAVEELAQDHPHETWASIPKDPDLKTGWRNVTYQELAYAVDGSARWAEANVGVGDNEGVVAYMGSVHSPPSICCDPSANSKCQS